MSPSVCHASQYLNFSSVSKENKVLYKLLLLDQAAPLQASESNVSYSVNLGVHGGDFVL